MARKHKILTTVLAVGCGAAAGYLIYRNRDLLRSFVEELTAPAAGQDDYAGEVIRFDPEPETAPAAPETDIIIDRTAEEAEPIEQC